MKPSFENNRPLIVTKYLPYSFFIQQNVTPLKFPILSLKKSVLSSKATSKFNIRTEELIHAINKDLYYN